MVKEIEINELKNMIDSDNTDVALIDVRNNTEIANGCIPGSRNMPLHTVPLHQESLHQESLQKNATVVLYCHSGARSAQACRYLAELGHQNVYNLKGGILAWVRTGLQLA